MWEGLQETMKTLWGNLKEAERYTHKAEMCQHPARKRWMLMMAEKHLAFDDEGLALLHEQLNEMEKSGHMPDLMPGIRKVYEHEAEEVRHSIKELQEQMNRHK